MVHMPYMCDQPECQESVEVGHKYCRSHLQDRYLSTDVAQFTCTSCGSFANQGLRWHRCPE